MTFAIVWISIDSNTEDKVVIDTGSYHCGCGGEDGVNHDCYCQTGDADFESNSIDKIKKEIKGNYNCEIKWQ